MAFAKLYRYLACAYLALIVYASLHPFSGWHYTGISPFVFLEWVWPRYWTAFDMLANMIAYLPLGFLMTMALAEKCGRGLAGLLAALLGAALSLSLEAIQTYLPSRVPSCLDFVNNTVGALLGVICALCCGQSLVRGLRRFYQALSPKAIPELAILYVGAWLLIQLSPEIILFGAGDLRYLLNLPPLLSNMEDTFFAIETMITVCNILSIGLILRALIADVRLAIVSLCLFFPMALAIRTLSAAILLGPLESLAWFTPSAGLGLMLGGGLLALALLLPSQGRFLVAGLALMAGTVLVNIAPPNPYSSVAAEVWYQGHFLNFNGLTRLLAALWPFLVLPYVSILGRRHA